MSTASVSNERLTWQQMTERYPDRWVGLKDIEYEPDGVNIISAVVAIDGDGGTVIDARNDGIVDYAIYTTPDKDIYANWSNCLCSPDSTLTELTSVQ